jgi:hypothetical protein
MKSLILLPVQSIIFSSGYCHTPVGEWQIDIQRFSSFFMFVLDE